MIKAQECSPEMTQVFSPNKPQIPNVLDPKNPQKPQIDRNLLLLIWKLFSFINTQKDELSHMCNNAYNFTHKYKLLFSN